MDPKQQISPLPEFPVDLNFPHIRVHSVFHFPGKWAQSVGALLKIKRGHANISSANSSSRPDMRSHINPDKFLPKQLACAFRVC